MAWLTENLSHHLARDRRRSLARGKDLALSSQGAVLFADIAGFTRLTSGLLSALGDARGAEELTRVLEGIYDALIAPVHAYGGSVVTFSGDAITCWFEGADANRAGAVARAMHAAVSALDLRPGGHALELGVKVGIGQGKVLRLAPGASQWQRIDTLAGPPVVQAAEAERLAKVGETILSAAAAATLSPEGRVEPEARGGYFVLREATASLAGGTEPDDLEKSAATPFVLSRIREHLARGRARYLAEIRPVCAVFISFRGLEGASSVDVERHLDEFVRAVQLVLDELEGVLIGVTIGDKGSYLNAAFGAPVAHEDDVARAVAAAAAIVELESHFAWLTDLGIGISHGRMRAGTFGSQTRKAYAVLGEYSNKAALLMQSAGSGEVLLDEGARSACEGSVVVEAAGELFFKGTGAKQAIYRYRSKSTETERQSSSTPFLGRVEECATFGRHLERLIEGQGSVVVIEGEAGVGKSRLLQAFGELADESDFMRLYARGDSLERSSPYHAWRECLAKALGYPERSESAEAAMKKARGAFPKHLDPELLPLLSPALRFSVAETPTSEQLRGEARADNTLSLMAEVLAARIPDAGAIVVAEDGHWFDSASWSVLAHLRALRPKLLVVVGSRPPEPDVPDPEYGKWRDAEAGAEEVQRSLIELGGMNAEQLRAVVAARVGADTVEASLGAALHQRTAGHPFFGEELALSLMGEELVKIEGGELALRDSRVSLESVDFPATVEGVVRSRLDRLPSGADLVLKVAATLGFTFSLGALLALHPGSAEEIDLALETLARNQVIVAKGHDEFVFRHAIVRQVTYQQMLDDQRRDFHGKAAAWYEAQVDWDRDRGAPLLAHHWLAAGEQSRALNYLDRAADLALEQGAYREAIRFSTLASEADSELGGQGERRAYVTGSAYMGMGEISQARDALENSLARSGRPVPSSKLGLALAIAGQICTQLFHRMFPGSLLRDREDAAERERAALTLTEITPAYYLGNDVGRMFYANLRSMNLTERALCRPVARGVVAECYATTTLISSAMGANRITGYYERLAREMLPRVPALAPSGQTRMLFALLYMGEGRCPEALGQIERACEIFTAAGDRRRYEVAAGTKAFILGYLGDHEAALEQWHEVAKLGRSRQHQQSRAMALNGIAECLLVKGKETELERVEQYLAEASRAYPEGNDHMFDVQSAALRGDLAFRSEKLALAAGHFFHALELIESRAPLSGYAMGSYNRVGQGIHDLLAAGAVPRSLAVRATKKLKQYGAAFALAKPASLVCESMLALHDGKNAKATRLRNQAQLLAGELSVPLALTAPRNSSEV